jgi:hypothetical protein
LPITHALLSALLTFLHHLLSLSFGLLLSLFVVILHLLYHPPNIYYILYHVMITCQFLLVGWTTSYALRAFWGRNILLGAVAPQRDRNFLIWTRPKTSGRLARFPQKNRSPCILEGHFSTNPILSAFHLQGPKANIHIQFH